MIPVPCAVVVTDGEENDPAPNRKKIHSKMIHALPVAEGVSVSTPSGGAVDKHGELPW